MDILNKPINSFGFQEIVAFCQEGHREGIQLDYKKDIPTNLSKHFAAFSNTRGGVIIVGVEENRQTGIPNGWIGVNNAAKSIEKIHQWASNVTPIPRYEVRVTDEQGSKVFILVRIFEGDRTPYYVQNDANLWVRTGNISTPIDIASPDYVELLFKKKEQAGVSRNRYIAQAKAVYEVGLRNAERERVAKISAEQEEYRRKKAAGDPAIIAAAFAGGFVSRFYQQPLGSQASMCTILVQPFYPKEALMKPSDIKDKTREIRDLHNTPQMYYPDLNLKPIPEGVFHFEWGEMDGQIDCHQIYAAGLLYSSTDVLMVNNEEKIIYLSHVIGRLFQILKAANNFYQLSKYQGGLEGYVEIKGTEDIKLVGVQQQMFFRDLRGMMPEYKLDFSDLDTTKLADPVSFQEFYIDFVKELFWSIGYQDFQIDVIKRFLKDSQWLLA